MKKIIIFMFHLFLFTNIFSFQTEVIEKSIIPQVKFSQTLKIYPENNKFPNEEDLQKIAYKIKSNNLGYENYFIHFILPDMILGNGGFAVCNSTKNSNPEMKAKILFDDLLFDDDYKKYVKETEDGKLYLTEIIPDNLENIPAFEKGLYFKVIEKQKEGFVKFKILTNLPDETELMFSLEKGDYMGQDKVVVKNNFAETDFFSFKGSELKKGTYSLEITTPLTWAQESDKVKEILGEKGKNLKGKYVVKENDDLLNTGENKIVKYVKKVIIK